MVLGANRPITLVHFVAVLKRTFDTARGTRKGTFILLPILLWKNIRRNNCF